MRRPVRRERLCELFFDIPDDPRAALRWSLSASPATPNNAVSFLRAFAEIDVRHRLSEIKAPTLVLHARGDQRVGIYQA